MKVDEVAKLIDGIILSGKNLLDKIDVKTAFAADLMSDVLAYVESDNNDVILITGITNPQIVRTAEMLDIPVIIVARGKTVPNETIKLADEKGIIIISTKNIVFTTSGILYTNGIKPAKIKSRGESASSC
ncbi:MAG TPA: DRTGG domain-containing protein [Caldisericia bacterium]|nr:DRTGG domain-containing protein [Caldisericia bacterium]HON83026.1 DRTGG domain-containing protein [Caldisericia bacterium]HRT37299.1 DRTGG domain-containing protein [Caldisericia bacterium]